MDEQTNIYVHTLKLFTAGDTPSSIRATTSLTKMLEERLKDKHSLEIIDVIDRPRMAETFNIIATPTLLIVRPEKNRMIIGDLSDTDKVMAELE